MGRKTKEISSDTIQVIGNVSNNIQQATDAKKTRPIATQEDKEDRERTGRTQGKKGCRAKRMNFAFWTETYDYVQTMAKVNGDSIAKFVNETLLDCMKKDRKYNAIKAVLEDKYDDDMETD